ncbi:unnamed protein product [Tilletia controversa]|nr:unnamed protein product [Tilletia controversa]
MSSIPPSNLDLQDGPSASQPLSQASSVPDPTGFSQSWTDQDSATGNSQLADHDMEDLDYEDQAFLNDDPESSQELATPTLSQDLAGLSPPGSLSATRIIRPGPGTYRDRAASADDESLVDWYDEYEETPSARSKTPTPRSVADSVSTPITPSPVRPVGSNGVAASVHAPGRPTHVPAAAAPTTTDPAGLRSASSSATTRTSPYAPSAPEGRDGNSEVDGPGSDDDTDDNAAASNPPPVQKLRPGHYLNGQSMWRLDRGMHPDPDWTTVAQIADTRANPPNCTIRAVLPDFVQPAAPIHAFELYGAISDAILPRLENLRGNKAFHIELIGGRRKCVQISFAEPEAMAAMRDLVMPVGPIEDHIGFVLDSWTFGEPLGTRYVAWQVRHPGAPPSVALRVLQASIKRKPNLRLIEAWGVNYHMGPEPAPKMPTNTLVALLYVLPPRGANHATPLTDAENKDIPVWICGHGANFAGKSRWCHGCKDDAQAKGDYHMAEQCTVTTIPCAVCYDRGHVGAHCPRNKRPPPTAHTAQRDTNNNNTEEVPQPGEDDDFTILSSKQATTHDDQEYHPSGPSPTTPYPKVRRTTTANVVPVAGPSRLPTSPRGRGRGRGRGQAQGLGPSRTTFQQAYITPTGGFARPAHSAQPTSPSPQARKRRLDDTERS